MSTANFKPMKYNMPLVCNFGYYDDDGNIDQFLIDDQYCYAKGIMKEFADDLVYHDISIESGYYLGFQFYVSEKYESLFDLDKQSEYCIDNEDAHYYFGNCRSKVLRAADSEKRKIRRWLESLRDSGFDVLVVVDVFSNGEVVYDKKMNV